MKNLFFYTRKEIVAPAEENTETTFKEYEDAFNIQKIIRAVTLEDGRMLVLLDDLHQRMQEVPVHNKQGKVTAMKNVMQTFQSEIYLEHNDALKLRILTFAK
jgi:hypothetical protein